VFTRAEPDHRPAGTDLLLRGCGLSAGDAAGRAIRGADPVLAVQHRTDPVHYSFEGVDGGGWGSYCNSLRLSVLTAVIGTVVVIGSGVP
jgi:hypothetical protein